MSFNFDELEKRFKNTAGKLQKNRQDLTKLCKQINYSELISGISWSSTASKLKEMVSQIRNNYKKNILIKENVHLKSEITYNNLTFVLRYKLRPADMQTGSYISDLYEYLDIDFLQDDNNIATFMYSSLNYDTMSWTDMLGTLDLTTFNKNPQVFKGILLELMEDLSNQYVEWLGSKLDSLLSSIENK